MRRANPEHIPRTLTPWEWEQWYREHGYPGKTKPGRLERLKRFFKR